MLPPRASSHTSPLTGVACGGEREIRRDPPGLPNFITSIGIQSSRRENRYVRRNGTVSLLKITFRTRARVRVCRHISLVSSLIFFYLSDRPFDLAPSLAE